MTERDTVVVLRRACRRAGFHLIRAAVESLKAVEVVLDELARASRGEGGEPENPPGRVRIDVE